LPVTPRGFLAPARGLCYTWAVDALRTYAVVDLETTGLDPAAGDHICEIAIVRLRGGEVQEAFETLVNPQRSIPAEVQAMTKISSEMVRGAPAFAQIATQVVKLLANATPVAHNAAFDLSFLDAELRACGAPLLAGPVLDTLALARRCFPGKGHSLRELNKALRLGASAAHRARADVETTIALLQRCEQELARTGRASHEALLEIAGLVPVRAERGRAWLPLSLARALDAGGEVRMAYRARSGDITTRVVKPLRLEAAQNRVYLVAYCKLRGAERTFRTDRIIQAEPCAESKPGLAGRTPWPTSGGRTW